MRVLNEEPGFRKSLCFGCGHTLAYERADVQADYEFSGMGDVDVSHFIRCPVCSRRIDVSAWKA